MNPKNERQYYKNEELLKQIGARIRAFRSEKNISQESLANEFEMDYSQINRMELGKVNFSISHLYKIAEILKVNPKELLP